MRPLLVSALIFSMTVLPIPSSFAAGKGTPSPEKVRLRNVELGPEGTVTGRLLDETGQPIANHTVEVHIAKTVQKHTTAADGTFVVESSVGGNCAVIVDKRAFVCRLWANGTAPPKSLQQFEIVNSDKPIVRGQGLWPCSGSQLLGLGLLAGAIVAIVLAIDNDDDGS